MPAASGVAKLVAIKEESSWGVAPGAASAKYLRRVESDLSIVKDTYQSNEIRSDYQIADMRHGVRRGEGSISGELAPGSYQDFMTAALRKAFSSVANITALTLTVAASGSNFTITRSAGDWMAGNIKVGMVVRVTAGLNANSLNRNLFVLAVTATVLTVKVLNGDALTVEAAVAGCTVTVPGMRSWVPLTGHLDKSYAIEHWYSDVAQSELFLGMKVQTMDFSMPPTGIATIKFGMLGSGGMTVGTAQYYTTPTAAAATGVVAAVNGALIVNGAAVGLLTGLSFSVKGGHSYEPVVGLNTLADIFEGRVVVDGQCTVFFQDATMRDYFLNETEVGIAVALTTGNTGAAEFITFAMPRVKFGSATKNDGERGLVQTMNFTALLVGNGGAAFDHEQTTLMIQDSLAV